MVQIRAVWVRLDFAGIEVIKVHPLGIKIDHVELGKLLRQKPDDLAVRTPEGFAGVLHEFLPVFAIDVHYVQAANRVASFTLIH